MPGKRNDATGIGEETKRKLRELDKKYGEPFEDEAERDKQERAGVPGKSSTYSREEADELTGPLSDEDDRSGTDTRQ